MYRVDESPPQTVRLLATSLHVALEHLTVELPSFASRELATSLECFAEWALRYYDAALQEADQESDPTAQKRLIDRVFSGVLRKLLSECAKIIHQPGIEDYPQEIAVACKEWLTTFGQVEAQSASIALLPHWPVVTEIKFFQNPLRTIERDIEQLLGLERLEGLDDVLGSHPRQFLLIAFPRVYGRNALFHPIIFHELSHAIDIQNNLTQTVCKGLNLSPSDDKAGQASGRIVDQRIHSGHPGH